jgi:TolB-like protein/Tfp pilus assembly protein PilF
MADEPSHEKRKPKRVAPIVGAAAALLLVLFVVGRRHGGPHVPPAEVRPTAAARPEASRRATAVAVLPLQNLSGDPRQEYLADGFTEELITDLAQIDALRVISRTSVMRYKGGGKPLRQIADELGVGWIVEGSVLRDGSRVRVIAQLIEAASDQHVWTQTYDRRLGDVLALQADVTRAIARAVNVAVSPAVQARAARPRPLVPDAYIAYLRGRYEWNRRTEDSLRSAIRFFEEAIAADPGYAEAYAGLADTYNILGGYDGAHREGLRRASAAALRAVELDDGLAEAHTSLAWMRFRAGWDWEGAEASFRRALALNPGYATAHQWYSSFLATLGRHEEALPEAKRAVDLDPLSPVMHRSLAIVHLLARRFPEAEASVLYAIELDRDVPVAHFTLARVRAARDDLAGAMDAARRVPRAQWSPDSVAFVAYLQARMGDPSAARRLVKELEEAARQGRSTAHNRALLHLGLGDNEAALDALDAAVQERSPFVIGLKTQPVLDPLREHPRFQELLRAVRLAG